MENSFPPISYAECVKTNSNVSQHVDSNTAPMSWYDQVESYQNSIMVSHFDRLIYSRINLDTLEKWKIKLMWCLIYKF